MKTLKDYEVDELVTLLEELRYRAEEDDEIQEEVDSMLALLKDTKDE